MRVSFFNCVSTALDMLEFSTDSILNNAGYSEFDYIVVTWCPSDEVLEYINSYSNIIHVSYQTNNTIGYVPNLRAMINSGFDYGFNLNKYCGLLNTDMYAGEDWLLNLIKYISEDTIVNSTHISPIKGKHVITANLGIPTYETFNLDKFNKLYKSLYRDILETEDERGGWRNTNTMPYIFHKKWWDKCGPWELKIVDRETPDRRFFERCHIAGAKFTMSRSSIAYHHEAVERRRARPKDAEGMSNE